MTSAMPKRKINNKKKGFDSHGILIDHNTAVWYVVLGGALSPEYQWSPTDRQTEWGISSRAYSYFIFHVLLLQPILFCCVQFCLPRFIFLRFLSRSYFNLFSLLTSPPPPPPSPPSHPPNICVKSLSMPRPGSVGHIRTQFPLFFSQKESSSPERWSKDELLSPLLASLCVSSLSSSWTAANDAA